MSAQMHLTAARLAHAGRARHTQTTIRRLVPILISSLATCAVLPHRVYSTVYRTTRAGVISYGAATGYCHCTPRRGSATARPSFFEIQDALRVLGVGDEVDARGLKKRYRELVRTHHPDTGGSERTMSQITVAYNRLASMRRSDWESYRHQRYSMQARYHPGHTRASATSAAGYRAASQGYAYAHTEEASKHTSSRDGSSDDNGTSGSSGSSSSSAYARARAAQQEAYWSSLFYRASRFRKADARSGAGYGGPFSSASQQSPFSSSSSSSVGGFGWGNGGLFSRRYGSTMRGLRFASPGVLILQGLVFYLLLCSAFLFVFRRWRDRRDEDGWRMAESMARHEQMQELQRIRQELTERARAMAAGMTPEQLAAMRASAGSSSDAATAEARLAHARHARLQQQQQQQQRDAVRAPVVDRSSGAVTLELHELRGWPTLRADQGRLYRRPQDPVGVIVYEPRRVDERRRQVANVRQSQRGGRRASEGATEEERAAAAADGSGELTGLPESNVSAITAAVVNSPEETRAVIESILQKRKGSAG